MKISTKGIYALEAMIELALYDNDEYMSIHKISKNRKCSIKYLEQIFKLLKSNGLVVSTRGKEGGYQLAKNSKQITALEIILSVEGNLEPVPCLSNTCVRSSFCKTKPVWQGMQNEIYKILQEKTLFYLANQYKEVRK